MMNKYLITLGGHRFGSTIFEKSDPSMGCVFGLIEFEETISPYAFILEYCKKSKIEINCNMPEIELIDTQSINDLKVLNSEGVEINGESISISGSKDDGYFIQIIGIPFPFYSNEFPGHCNNHDESFKSITSRRNRFPLTLTNFLNRFLKR